MTTEMILSVTALAVACLTFGVQAGTALAQRRIRFIEADNAQLVRELRELKAKAE
ncbi:hypothetical protein OH791_33790 [Streptomyces anulatus]|uniref:hypothetical protein n=1 Tax=Streptomyces anulatus TaxID=1892 RepID=UPI00386934EF|nr:hypothetical protein OH791_33790 [Streptomyces anulatus]